MDAIYIVGNWKSNKTEIEAKTWLLEISNLKSQISKNKEIIICPPFTLLPLMKKMITELGLPIKLGAQNISHLGEGAYTGEINGKQIKEFADYVLIGHSERRKHFNEDNSMVIQKLDQAFSNDVIPILCVSQIEEVLEYDKDIIIAYEPLFAVGTGNPDTPENANKISEEIKKKLNGRSVIYGGSVTSENVHSFVEMSDINGVLPGKASLDAQEFSKIIQNA